MLLSNYKLKKIWTPKKARMQKNTINQVNLKYLAKNTNPAERTVECNMIYKSLMPLTQQ